MNKSWEIATEKRIYFEAIVNGKFCGVGLKVHVDNDQVRNYLVQKLEKALTDLSLDDFDVSIKTT